MNDFELVAVIEKLVQRESEVILELLLHLGELDRREAYRGLGYCSLYDYCTRHLRYAESAASRRIKAARCIRDFPAVRELLRGREVSLSTIVHFAPHLNKENEAEMLAAVRGKSKEDVKQFVASLAPKKFVPKEVIRAVQVKPVQKPVEEAPLFVAPVVIAEAEPTKKVIQISVTLTEEEYADFCRLQKIRSRSGRIPKAKDLFIAGVTELLKKEDPKLREERRQKRADAKSQSPEPVTSTTITRHIPAPTADQVLNESNICCSFTANGVKCTNTVGVQIDHIKPFGMGGTHEQSNLRALCRVHNQYAAEKVYGKDFIDQQRQR